MHSRLSPFHLYFPIDSLATSDFMLFPVLRTPLSSRNNESKANPPNQSPCQTISLASEARISKEHSETQNRTNEFNNPIKKPSLTRALPRPDTSNEKEVLIRSQELNVSLACLSDS